MPRCPACGALMRRYATRCPQCHQADADALFDEITRLNQALESGATAVLNTYCGPFCVRRVSESLEAVCCPYAGGVDDLRSFTLAPDASWSALLFQAGVDRNPRFLGTQHG